MTKSGAIVDAGQDFEFSCDFEILREYTGCLYLGDKRSPEVGTYIRFTHDTYAGADIALRVVVD